MAPAANSVDAQELQVGGILTDAEGNTWAVPADGTEDLSDLGAPGPMDLPKDKMDPRFHYQWIRLDQWPHYQSRQFARVTEKEMGRLHLMEAQYGQSPTTYMEYCGTMLVKCPKFIAERIERDKEHARLLALDGTQPTEQMLESARRGAIIERTIRDTKIGDEPGMAPRKPGRPRRQ